MSLRQALAGGLAAAARHGRVVVWPCCEAYEALASLRNAAPAGCQIMTMGPALNDAARDLADLLQNIEEAVWPQGAAAIDWLSSDLADRGPYVSGLALNLARRRVIAAGARAPALHLVVADDAATARALAGMGQRRRDGATDLARRLAGRVRGLLRFARRLAAAKATRRSRARRLSRLREAEVLLVAWASPDTFAAKDVAAVRSNLETLPAMLAAAGIDTAFLANPLDWLYPIEDIAGTIDRSGLPAVAFDECLSLRAAAAACVRGLSITTTLTLPLVHDGVDYSEVVRLEARKSMRGFRAPFARLFDDAIRFLAEHHVCPRQIVLAFENQPWEKCLVHAVRRHLPDTEVIGVQIVPFARNYLSMYPGRRDLARWSVPDLLIVMGDLFARWFVARGFPAERLRIGGSLRFTNLARPRDAETARPPGQAMILCSLSIEWNESLELAAKAAAALEGQDGVRMIVNFHPLTGAEWQDNLRAALADQAGPAAMARVEFSTRHARELIADADAMLYNSSGVAIDAVIMGIPVIYVERDNHIDYDKLPAGVATHCADTDELSAAVADLIAHGAGARTQASAAELDGLFVQAREAVFIDTVRKPSRPQQESGRAI